MAQRDTRDSHRASKRTDDGGVRQVRSTTDRPRITSVADLYGGGETGNMLQGRYDTAKIHSWFQRRHKRGRRLLDDEGYYHARHRGKTHKWRVPYGVRAAMSTRLTHSQIATKYPWYVTWRSPATHHRFRKKFSSPIAAIHFITTRAQYVDPKASVVSRHGYDIPPKLRGRLPRPWKWCPGCMQPRKYKPVEPEVTFWAQRKRWDQKKKRYIWIDMRVRLIQCPVCDFTNRNEKFRRSNQPWEIRKFKPGVMRARRRSR